MGLVKMSMVLNWSYAMLEINTYDSKVHCKDDIVWVCFKQVILTNKGSGVDEEASMFRGFCIPSISYVILRIE